MTPFSTFYILKAITTETGKSLEDIKQEKGVLRQMAMELLYRLGGLKGVEIGRILDVGYTSVSQERRRLHERMQHDKKIVKFMHQLERKCKALGTILWAEKR